MRTSDLGIENGGSSAVLRSRAVAKAAMAHLRLGEGGHASGGAEDTRGATAVMPWGFTDVDSLQFGSG